MKPTTNQLRDLASLFSRSESNRWFRNDLESIDAKLLRYNLLTEFKGKSYLSFLRKSYINLKKYYPNEYVLKNEFLNQWLKDELGNSDSVIFNEFKIGKSIADLAMFNGISKAFEIKTILDKEYRLSSQLQEYKKIFNEVYIIIPNQHLSKYLSYDESVGVIAFENPSDGFEIIRKPTHNREIDRNVIMKVLHCKEYLGITKEYYGELPPINSFNQFEICKELIANIPTDSLNQLFLKYVKTRKINNQFFDNKNTELNQISLSLNLKRSQINDLVDKLNLNIPS